MHLFPIYFLRDNTALTITPAIPEILKLLTFQEKTMQVGSGSKKEKIRLFEIISQSPLGPVIMTYHGLWKRIKEHVEALGYRVEMQDHRPPFPLPKMQRMFGFRGTQRQWLISALRHNESGLIGAPTRFGKCFSRGTPVLMVDGTIRPIETIRDGDLVMGPDSKPRRVAGCTSGVDEMYRVIPNYNGMPWLCNSEHILHVQRTGEGGKWCKKGRQENITLRDWINATPHFRHVRKLRKVSVDFPKSHTRLSPYVYGAWLGDGHSEEFRFTNMEAEIWSELNAWADTNGMHVVTDIQAGAARTRSYIMKVPKKGGNFVRQWIRANRKVNGIAREHLITDRESRMELLAGLIDTDGEINGGKNLAIVTKYKKLAEDIVFLCNSLGLPAVSRDAWKNAQGKPKKLYHRVMIRGAVDQLPLRVPRKVCVRKNKFNALTPGFKVEPAGVGEYFGFTLEDPEGLFLLGDCTVVHNSIGIINTVRAYDEEVPTVITVPGQDLVRQTWDMVEACFPHRHPKWVKSATSKQSDLIVCSIDSLHHCDRTRTKLLIIDEPHASAADSRIPQIKEFKEARKIGFGATLKGRFDQRDLVIEGLIGPILTNKTYREAVAEGMICPITVIHVDLTFDPWNTEDRNQVMRYLLYQSPRVAAIARYVSEFLPADWQTLMFIKNEKQADYFHAQLQNTTIPVAMDKKLTAKQRKELTAAVKSGEVTRCICSDIYIQGVTFSLLRCLMNLSGGGPYTSAIQKPGRLAEIMPELNKHRGLLIDVTFRPSCNPHKRDMPGQAWRGIEMEGKGRLKVYREIGYDIRTITTFKQMAALLTEFMHE